MAENNVIVMEEKKSFKVKMKEFGQKTWDKTKKAAPKIAIGLGGFAAGVGTGLLVAMGLSKSPEDDDGPIVSGGYDEDDSYDNEDEDDEDDYEYPEEDEDDEEDEE